MNALNNFDFTHSRTTHTAIYEHECLFIVKGFAEKVSPQKINQTEITVAFSLQLEKGLETERPNLSDWI